MIRFMLPAAFLLAFAARASAHFVFVVPEPGAARAAVVFSETLDPDEDVDVASLAAMTLHVRHADGREAALDLGTPAGHAYRVDLPAGGHRVVRGTLVFGVQQRGKAPPFLLTYHPKTVMGDPFAPAGTLGDAADAEIVATGKPGELVFEVRFQGKPVPAAKVTVITPDGSEKEVATGQDGRTPSFDATGRFGVWARCEEGRAGEHDGKPFEQVRHYPTLVIDVPAYATNVAPPTADAARATVAAVPADARIPGHAAAAKGHADDAHAAEGSVDKAAHAAPRGEAFAAKLPEATSSFGAAACDGYVYVYGGHVAPTHHYDTKAVSGRFHRLKLDGPAAWESLPAGPGLQGMNLVTHGGKLYRVGGMRPVNAPGDDVDNRSVDDCARFDPATGRWETLPPLPEPRSSHDVVAVGNRLFALGGWTMNGPDGNAWPDTAAVLDLASAEPRWTSIPQPFRRRAMIAAVHRGKVYVIGGFDQHDDPSRRVDVYDPATGDWTTGPELPGKSRNGFAPAACVADDGRLYVSVADGTLYGLADSSADDDDDDARWEPAARTTPRIVHRLIPHAGQILVLGGAAKGDNLDLIETVTPAP